MPEPARAGDESVGSLVRRRVGDEIFETLVEPLLSGVYAGSADRLSAQVAKPQFVSALHEHGSLIKGLRAQVGRADRDAPVFYGLRRGTRSLVDALAREIDERGGRVVLGARVESLRRTNGSLHVAVADSPPIETDAVVVTAPDHAVAPMLDATVPEVARDLRSVRYASVALVALEVDPADVPRPLDGTGFIVPDGEDLLLTACSWASSKWGHLRDGTIILRASAGRAHDERAEQLTDDELVARLQSDLERTMDLAGPPRQALVARWPHALAQFEPGHLDRVARWRREIGRNLPGVVLAGAGIEGLGIPACIRQARRAVDQLLGDPHDTSAATRPT
jgi:oxygen-dependent protoporphyrinogen oxidase